MLNKRQQFGKESESIAVRHLKKNGYKILEQNYRNKLGEIDMKEVRDIHKQVNYFILSTNCLLNYGRASGPPLFNRL
jgi:hypothetical protein